MPTSAIHEQLLAVAERELQQAFNQMPDLSDDEKRILKQLSYRIVQRVLQAPAHAIQVADCGTQQEVLIAALNDLFDME